MNYSARQFRAIEYNVHTVIAASIASCKAPTSDILYLFDFIDIYSIESMVTQLPLGCRLIAITPYALSEIALEYTLFILVRFEPRGDDEVTFIADNFRAHLRANVPAVALK